MKRPRMKYLMRLAIALAVALCSAMPIGAQKPLRIAVTGESNLRAKFVEAVKDAGRGDGLSLEIVPRSDEGRNYTIIIDQESSIAGAAAAVIALDRDGEVAASVVRSGRLSGSGAMNACAKELAKKLAVLTK